jgi:hypothetical protein
VSYQPTWSGQDSALRDELDRISQEFRRLNALLFLQQGIVNPTGIVLPRFIGDTYHNTVANTLWMATDRLTSAWKQI